MLLYPSVDYLTTKVDSKYTLAILSAKRARDLIDKKPWLIDNVADNEKPLSIATAEIAEELISYKRTENAEPAEKAEVPAAEEAEAVLTEETAE